MTLLVYYTDGRMQQVENVRAIEKGNGWEPDQTEEDLVLTVGYSGKPVILKKPVKVEILVNA